MHTAHRPFTVEDDTLEAWHIDNNNYTVDDDIVGQGKFGIVRVGEWRGTKVAVKCLFNNDNDINKTMVKKEIHFMQELHHPCIVQFLGFSNDHEKGDLVILMEYLVNGSLEDYVLKNNKSIPINLKRQWCHEMSQALAYLHNRKPTFLIHRDVKPSNFMLTSVLRCKLGDFGISRLFNRVPDLPQIENEEDDEEDEEEDEDEGGGGGGGNFWKKSSGALSTMLGIGGGGDDNGSDSDSDSDMDQTSNVGTLRYMAPEVRGVALEIQQVKEAAEGVDEMNNRSNPLVGEIKGEKSRYSVQADIFSLGMVFYFVFEGVAPHVMGADDPISHFKHLQNGKRPLCKQSPPTMRRIIELCLRWKPTERPSSLELIKLIEGIPIQNTVTTFGVKKVTILPVEPSKLKRYKEIEAKIEARRETSKKGTTSPLSSTSPPSPMTSNKKTISRVNSSSESSFSPPSTPSSSSTPPSLSFSSPTTPPSSTTPPSPFFSPPPTTPPSSRTPLPLYSPPTTPAAEESSPKAYRLKSLSIETKSEIKSDVKSDVKSETKSLEKKSSIPDTEAVLEKWHLPEKSFTIDEGMLGQGKFGVVRLGERHGTTVAVKCLFNNLNKAKIYKEISLMQQLHHPCIVQFLGFSKYHAQGDLVIVMEYLENGNLENYIELKFKSISLAQKVKWCSDMSSALSYLHNRKPTFLIHRDVKPSNFMLTSALTCKLGDFGISRLFDRVPDSQLPKTASNHNMAAAHDGDGDGYWNKGAAKITSLLGQISQARHSDMDDQTSNVGTLRYMAPEVRGVALDKKKVHLGITAGQERANDENGKEKGKKVSEVVRTRYSVQVDIFSIGMVFYYIFEGISPKINGASDPFTHFSNLSKGKRPVCTLAPPAARRIIELCLRWQPMDRPTSLELIPLVEAIPTEKITTKMMGVIPYGKETFAVVSPNKLKLFKEIVAQIEERRKAGSK